MLELESRGRTWVEMRNMFSYMSSWFSLVERFEVVLAGFVMEFAVRKHDLIFPCISRNSALQIYVNQTILYFFHHPAWLFIYIYERYLLVIVGTNHPVSGCNTNVPLTPLEIKLPTYGVSACTLSSLPRTTVDLND